MQPVGLYIPGFKTELHSWLQFSANVTQLGLSTWVSATHKGDESWDGLPISAPQQGAFTFKRAKNEREISISSSLCAFQVNKNRWMGIRHKNTMRANIIPYGLRSCPDCSASPPDAAYVPGETEQDGQMLRTLQWQGRQLKRSTWLLAWTSPILAVVGMGEVNQGMQKM